MFFQASAFDQDMTNWSTCGVAYNNMFYQTSMQAANLASCRYPSSEPTGIPSGSPSVHPSSTPSLTLSGQPSISPSAVPSKFPSETPSKSPSKSPSESPIKSPSEFPSESPSEIPAKQPFSNNGVLRTEVQRYTQKGQAAWAELDCNGMKCQFYYGYASAREENKGVNGCSPFVFVSTIIAVLPWMTGMSVKSRISMICSTL
jgi:hypothetical protein